MKALSITVRALVLTAIALEETNQEIQRNLKQEGHKVTIKQIQFERDELARVAETGQNSDLAKDDLAVIKAQEEVIVVDDKATKLAAMLKASQEVKAEVKAPKAKGSRATVVTTKVPHSSSKTEDGTARQRRNYEVTDRKITVFTSESSKEVFVATNLAFTIRTYEGALSYARRDKALVKRAPMFANADLKMTIIETKVPVGEELNVAKARAMDEYIAKGYSLVGKRPKVAVTELPVQEEAPAEQPAETVSEEATA